MAHVAERGLVWIRRCCGAVSGVVCQNRIAGSVQLPPVTRIKRCRDGTCGGARSGVDQALAWRGAVSGVVCQFRIVGNVHFPPVTRIKSLRTPK